MRFNIVKLMYSCETISIPKYDIIVLIQMSVKSFILFKKVEG